MGASRGRRRSCTAHQTTEVGHYVRRWSIRRRAEWTVWGGRWNHRSNVVSRHHVAHVRIATAATGADLAANWSSRAVTRLAGPAGIRRNFHRYGGIDLLFQSDHVLAVCDDRRDSGRGNSEQKKRSATKRHKRHKFQFLFVTFVPFVANSCVFVVNRSRRNRRRHPSVVRLSFSPVIRRPVLRSSAAGLRSMTNSEARRERPWSDR